MGLALVNGAYLFLDPYVSLYQYKFAPFLAGIAPVGKAWYAYLFKPEMGLGFGDTFGFTDSALNADPGADGSIIRVRSHPEKLYVVCGNGKFRLTRKDITIKEDLNEQLAITTDPNPKRLIAITIDNESFSAVLTNWPRNGTLLKFQNATDPKKEELAFVVGGAALDVDCESALRQMGRDESEACLIPTAAARLMRTRVPVDGTLLKEWSGSTIYKMDQGVRRTFEGGDGAEVVKVPDGSLKVLPLVDSVTRIGTSSR